MVNGSSRFGPWKMSSRLPKIDTFQPSSAINSILRLLTGTHWCLFSSCQKQKRGDPGFFLSPVFQMESHETNDAVQILGINDFLLQKPNWDHSGRIPLSQTNHFEGGLPRSLVLHFSTCQIFSNPVCKTGPIAKKISDFAGIIKSH